VKKQLLLIYLLFTSLLTFGQAAAGTLEKLDEKYGFRDVKFETPVAKVPGLKLYYNDVKRHTKIYKRPTDKMMIGKYSLASVEYEFYKGVLSSVTIRTKGYINSTGVLKAFQELYGPGSQDNEYIEEYRWSTEKVLMNYEQNSITDDAIIYIWSVPMMDKSREDEAVDAQKATSDL
jgi:hypothetical protein